MTALLGFALIALLPLLFDQLVATSHAWRSGRLPLAKSFLIFAVGNLALLPALFRSRFVGMLAVMIGLTALMSAWTLSSTNFAIVSFSILALSLPLTYLLLQRRVTLGRAPSLTELLRS